MTRKMPQDTALPMKSNSTFSWTPHPSRCSTRSGEKSHAVTRIAWTSPASRTKHSWSFPVHAGSHLIRGDALCHREGAVLGRAAASSRHGSPQPSSDAEASTDRAPRPAVCNGRRPLSRAAAWWCVERTSRAASVEPLEEPVRAVKPTAAQAGVFIQRYGMRGRNDNDSGGATSPIPFTA